MKTSKNLLFSAALALLTACTPTVAQRGNMVENSRLEHVVPGIHSRSDVLRILGSPTTISPFDDKIWYYMGQETEKQGILDPEIVKERIVVVTFNDDGAVESVQEQKPGSRIDIPIDRDKTPTHGTDLTVMQQFLGNLGRFNPNTDDKKPGR